MTSFQLFRVLWDGTTSIMTKRIPGKWTQQEIIGAATRDEHCRQLFDQGWILDIQSVQHKTKS